MLAQNTLINKQQQKTFTTPIMVMVSDLGTMGKRAIWDNDSITRCNTAYINYLKVKSSDYNQARLELQQAMQEFLTIKEKILFNSPVATQHAKLITNTLHEEIAYIRGKFEHIEFSDVNMKCLSSALLSFYNKNLDSLREVLAKAELVQKESTYTQACYNFASNHPIAFISGAIVTGFIVGEVLYFVTPSLLSKTNSHLSSHSTNEEDSLGLAMVGAAISGVMAAYISINAKEFSERLELKKIYTANQNTLTLAIANLQSELMTEKKQYNQVDTTL